MDGYGGVDETRGLLADMGIGDGALEENINVEEPPVQEEEETPLLTEEDQQEFDMEYDPQVAMYFVEESGLPVPTWTFGGGQGGDRCGSNIAYRILYEGINEVNLSDLDDEGDEWDVRSGGGNGYKVLYQGLESLIFQEEERTDGETRVVSQDLHEGDGGEEAEEKEKKEKREVEEGSSAQSFVEDCGLLVPTWTFGDSRRGKSLGYEDEDENGRESLQQEGGRFGEDGAQAMAKDDGVHVVWAVVEAI